MNSNKPEHETYQKDGKDVAVGLKAIGSLEKPDDECKALNEDAHEFGVELVLRFPMRMVRVKVTAPLVIIGQVDEVVKVMTNNAVSRLSRALELDAAYEQGKKDAAQTPFAPSTEEAPTTPPETTEGGTDAPSAE